MIFAECVQGGVNQMGTNRSALTLPVGNVDLGHQEVKQAAQTLLGRGEGERAVIWRPPRRLSRADNERATRSGREASLSCIFRVALHSLRPSVV